MECFLFVTSVKTSCMSLVRLQHNFLSSSASSSALDREVLVKIGHRYAIISHLQIEEQGDGLLLLDLVEWLE